MSDEGEREGQQIGNYQLTRLLGRGNFADVYLGQHVHLHTLAAVKVLHGRLTVYRVVSSSIGPFA